MVAWASRLFVRSRPCFHGLSLGKKWKWLGHTHTETSRTRCVWGNTVVPELPSPPQRARPFHSHSIQTPASPFSLFHSQGVQTQASPFHLSRGVHIPLVFWVDHLFQPFFIVWCMDCLFCRFPGPKPVVPSLAQEAIAFHCHRVPDSFRLPLVMDSWKFIIEVHWTWSELHWSLFDIGRVFFWKERGIGRFSWALQDPARNHPPGDS